MATSTLNTRYQVRKARSGWNVHDSVTGAVWTGMVRVGARQLADRLNRNPIPLTRG
jgi:hypothetical protein